MISAWSPPSYTLRGETSFLHQRPLFRSMLSGCRGYQTGGGGSDAPAPCLLSVPMRVTQQQSSLRHLQLVLVSRCSPPWTPQRDHGQPPAPPREGWAQVLIHPPTPASLLGPNNLSLPSVPPSLMMVEASCIPSHYLFLGPSLPFFFSCSAALWPL